MVKFTFFFDFRGGEIYIFFDLSDDEHDPKMYLQGDFLEIVVATALVRQRYRNTCKSKSSCWWSTKPGDTWLEHDSVNKKAKIECSPKNAVELT